MVWIELIKSSDCCLYSCVGLLFREREIGQTEVEVIVKASRRGTKAINKTLLDHWAILIMDIAARR